MSILDPEDQSNHPILEKYLAEVLEKEPEALYQILHTFNFEQGNPEAVHLAKLHYSQYLKMLYIDQDKRAPEEFDVLEKELYAAIIKHRTLDEEVDLIAEEAELALYIKEHGLNDLLERVQNLDGEKSLDPVIDAEFVVSLHQQNFKFPEDDRTLADVYHAWLTAMFSF